MSTYYQHSYISRYNNNLIRLFLECFTEGLESPINRSNLYFVYLVKSIYDQMLEIRLENAMCSANLVFIPTKYYKKKELMKGSTPNLVMLL